MDSGYSDVGYSNTLLIVTVFARTHSDFIYLKTSGCSDAPDIEIVFSGTNGVTISGVSVYYNKYQKLITAVNKKYCLRQEGK